VQTHRTNQRQIIHLYMPPQNLREDLILVPKAEKLKHLLSFTELMDDFHLTYQMPPNQ
jgi:hypothetical protein